MALDRAKTVANAEKFVKSGKIVEAIAEYKKLAGDNSRDMNVINKLGDLCVRAGKNQDAMRYFLRIAEYYASDGFFLKAIAMYKKVNKLDPSHMDCLQKLAALYRQQGLTIEAKAQYLAVADHFVKAGQPRKALEVYPRILEIEPENMKVRVAFADLLARTDGGAEASREFRHVAQELAKKGMLDEAIKVAQRGIRAVPGDAGLMSLALSLTKEAQRNPGDMLSVVVEMAKTNGDNPRSLALLGEAYLCAGKMADAEKVFRRLQGVAEGAPPEVAAALGRYHLAKRNPEAALEWMSGAAGRLAEESRGSEATPLLAEFLRAFPDHRAGLQKAAEIAERAGDRKAHVEALQRLAEVQSQAGESDQAAATSRRLQEVDPENASHAVLVDSVEGGSFQPAPEAAPGAPARGPAVRQDIQEGALDLEAEPVPEAEVGADTPAAEDIAGEADPDDLYGPGSKIQEMQEADDSGEPEDDDFVSEHFTEAEVFVKYGLIEKAKEQLLKILGKYPRHVASHGKLKELYYEEGDKERAVGECLTLAEIMKGRGRAEEAQDFINEAIRIDPNNPRIKELAGGGAGARPAAVASRKPPPPQPAPPTPPPRQAAPAAAPVPAKAHAAVKAPATSPPPRPRGGPGAPRELEIESPEALAVDEGGASPDLEISAADDAGGSELEIEIDMPEQAPKRPVPASAAAGAGAAARALKKPEKVEEETPDDFLGGPTFGEDGGIDIEASGEAPVVAVGTPGMSGAGPGREPEAEKLGEVDFYVDQGLLEEARAVLFQLQKQYPGSQEVAQRFERANRPVSEPPAAPAEAAPAEEPLGVDLDVERAFGSKTIAVPVPTRPGPVPRASKAKPVFRVEKPRAAEGDFFDLASELDKSLAEAQVAVDTQDQDAQEGTGHSMEEIFKAFRKGVEQQINPEDYDTHYNLGIAYKEMGLVDEAIGEFQYASKDPARAVECSGILGLCFREKGMPQLALKWYQKGLDMPGLGEHESLGLRYDVAEVYREQGEYGKAIQMYTEVYGMDSTYRDVAAKIKEMKKLLG
jgi:tetratricopeptide (TPR) repeat protein